MTTKLDPRLKPADDHTDSSPTTGTDGEEVKDVAIFESRRARDKRAWDELSELDRLVILESVRQRRKMRAHQDRIHTELFGLRANR
ncbi:hypothetical protein [Aeromicrobium sp.]|uniref:hypothetical protein n=1 Tax=Aeromicrobium sp. TaxID=1871063 RepID=UPI003D6A988D